MPTATVTLSVNGSFKVHSQERQRLRLHVRLCQDDNIVSMRMLRQMQRMGIEPILLCV